MMTAGQAELLSCFATNVALLKGVPGRRFSCRFKVA